MVPYLLTGSGPGELFIVRNVGNIVPAVERGVLGGVSAAIQYAIEVLEIGHVIVCGHTHCGAIDAILHPERVKHLPFVSRWLGESARIPELIEERYGHLTGEARITAAVEENVLVQLEHLRSFDFGWVFSIANGTVFDYDPHTEQFVAIGSGERSSTRPPPPAT